MRICTAQARAHRAEKKVRAKFVNISEAGEAGFLCHVVEWHELYRCIQRACLQSFSALRVSA
jgi:hypothetical protein